MDVAGSVAVVAGGAGLLGSATARRLASMGADVVIADIATGRASAVVDAFPDRARFAELDITDDAGVEALMAEANSDHRLRIAVVAAGTGVIKRTLSRDGSVHDLESFREMIEQHMVGSFVLLRRASQAIAGNDPLEHGERGVIVLTASLAGLEGSAGQIAYGAAKAGVAGMTLPAARDLAPVGIRVMTIAPGGMGAPESTAEDDPRVAALLANVPHPKRFGLPEDYALLATQIVENPYLNGSVIRLDGAARLGLKY